jgi:hypothetical protein
MANTITDVFKVQRPLGSSQPDPPFLIYNRTRSIEFFLPWEAALQMLLFPGHEAKTYWSARYDAKRPLFEPIRRVGDQPW